jgi:uncharacterized protein YrrD
MLDKVNSLKGYKLHCLDGEIGKVEEIFFDDKFWTVRYLVADTGNWLKDRQVLISPYAITSVNRGGKYLAVELTRKQIEESPSLASDKPVSRQYEKSYHDYYGWTPYWGGAYAWGPYSYLSRERDKPVVPGNGPPVMDDHLRSSRDAMNHGIEALDGEIGHVEDFIVDDGSWTVRYLLVKTGHWMAGKHVLISPRWITQVSWNKKMVYVNLSRESIEHSPPFTSETLLNRDYETDLHHHYDCKGYWLDELEAL